MKTEADQLVLPAEPVEAKQSLAEIEPMDRWERLLQVAIERNAGAEQFAMLVDAITKARREEARLQFEAALGRFKEHIPQIFRTKKVTYPNKDGSDTTYWHAELDKASDIIADELRKEGLAHSWKPSEGANGRTLVTCIFRHAASGHVEEMATLGGPPDSSGGKNSVQAIGSTTYYLERYTLLAAAGIVAKGIDNDGMTTTEGMPEDAITDYCIAMQDAADFPLLKPIFAECYKKAKDLGDKDAQKRLQKVYEERKKELWASKKEAAQ